MKLNQDYVNAYLGENNLHKLLNNSTFDKVQNTLGAKSLLELSVVLETIKQQLEEEQKRRNTENEN